jgi:hypothetical protein
LFLRKIGLAELAKSESMMGVLTFLLEFQIKQDKEETFISQTKYTHDILNKFGMDKAKPIKTPWALMDILTLIWVAHRLIKKYIAP